MSRLIIKSLEACAVSAETFDPSVHLEFNADDSVAPYALVLTNQAAKAVVGFALRWMLTRVGGQTRTHTFRSDSFGVSRFKPIIQAHGRVAISPNGFLPPRQPKRGVIVGSFKVVQQLDPAADATVELDAIAFEDGYVQGPDEAHLIANIEARKAAVDDLVATVRRAREEGHDLSGILAGFIAEPGSPQTNYRSFYLSMYARKLQRTVQGYPHLPESQRALINAMPGFGLDAQLNGLSNLPTPPKFFRDPRQPVGG